MKIASRRFSRRTRTELDGGTPREPQRYHSLAVGLSVKRLWGDEKKVEILDLGSACGETLAFYSGLPCKIFFADFYSDLKTRPLDPEEGIEGFVAACREVLPFPQTTRFDLVHSWDLFNYLSTDEIGALTTYLRRFTTDAAPLVSLIWTQKRIPAQPHRFAIIDTETVEYRPSTRSLRPGPRYKEPALMRAMTSYRPGRSFLLRHGVQEYVFEPRLGIDAESMGNWRR